MKTRHALAAILFVAAGGLVTGCGSEGVSGGCPVETPQINAIQSCTAQPGSTVSVLLRTCPTCNLTNPSCEVDLSGASGGTIVLDPVAERCADSSSCPPSCAVNEVVCTFTAPNTPDVYRLQVFDPASNQVRFGELDVAAASGPVACAF